jgi:hypothetical protein
MLVSGKVIDLADFSILETPKQAGHRVQIFAFWPVAPV